VPNATSGSVLPGDNGVQGHLDGPLSRRIVRHHNELAVLKVVEDRRVTGFSYEIRRWRGGSILDGNEAVSNPVLVANDLARAEQVESFVRPQQPQNVTSREGTLVHQGKSLS
jgi:hypothetical protein